MEAGRRGDPGCGTSDLTVRADLQGQGRNGTGRDRLCAPDGTEAGGEAGRDRETAEMRGSDGGGSAEQGPERRSHGSSL